MNVEDKLRAFLNLETDLECKKWLQTYAVDLTFDEILEVWKPEAERCARSNQFDQGKRIADAIREVGKLTGRSAIEGLAEWTMAHVYGMSGKRGQAAEHFELGSEHFLACEGYLQRARMSVGWIGTLIERGDINQAIVIAEEAGAILQKSDNAQDYAIRYADVLNNKAYALEVFGLYEDAISLYFKKIEIWEAQPESERRHAEIGRTHNNIGDAKLSINLFAEAEYHLQLAFKNLESLGDDWADDLARIASNLALLAIKQDKSQSQIDEAFFLVQELRARLPDEDALSLLYVELVKIESEIQAQKVDGELELNLNLLLERFELHSLVPEKIWADYLLALYQIKCGDIQIAIEILEDVIGMAREHQLWIYHYRASYQLGRCYHMRSEPEKGLAAWHAAVELIETTGRNLADGDSRAIFFDDKRIVYEGFVRYYLEKNDFSQLFYWIERTRAREVIDRLVHQNQDQFVDDSSRASVEKWRLIEKLRSQLNGSPNDDKMMLEQQIIDLKREISASQSKTGRILTFPQTTIQEISEGLAADTLFVQYFILDQKVWVWLIEKNGSTAPLCLGDCPSYDEVAQDYHWLTLPQPLNLGLVQKRLQQLKSSAQRPLTKWFDQFVQPILPQIRSYKRLIISPDGVLYRLPFHAFYNRDTQQYLIETHKVSLTAGGSAWLLGRKKEDFGTQKIAFGYNGASLLYAESEVNRLVTANLDWQVYAGKAATVKNFLNAGLPNAEIVHIAAHAYFREDNPLFSSIELADSKLETLDVLNLSLKTKLIVLSACESGHGVLRGGEYLGLLRAFLLSGSQSVFATYWSINDQATARFSDSFYESVYMGESFTKAMQSAAQQMLTDKGSAVSHPYYWAPFFLFGAP